MDRKPIPPQTPRADVLGRLRRERWHAANAKETAEVARIDREIERLSAAGTATAPTRETAASSPQRATAARTKTKGPHRGSAR